MLRDPCCFRLFAGGGAAADLGQLVAVWTSHRNNLASAPRPWPPAPCQPPSKAGQPFAPTELGRQSCPQRPGRKQALWQLWHRSGAELEAGQRDWPCPFPGLSCERGRRTSDRSFSWLNLARGAHQYQGAWKADGVDWLTGRPLPRLVMNLRSRRCRCRCPSHACVASAPIKNKTPRAGQAPDGQPAAQVEARMRAHRRPHALSG